MTNDLEAVRRAAHEAREAERVWATEWPARDALMRKARAAGIMPGPLTEAAGMAYTHVSRIVKGARDEAAPAHPPTLDDVADAAARTRRAKDALDAARARRDELIASAVLDGGHSQRELAEVAGLNQSRVQQIKRRATAVRATNV